MPTLAEITGAEIQTEEISGISLLPELTGKKQTEHEYLYWENPGSNGEISIRIGNFKGFAQDLRNGTEVKWELYDISSDPRETMDIASEHPELIARLGEIVAKEHTLSPHNGWRYKALGE
jgi:arylsulfatase